MSLRNFFLEGINTKLTQGSVFSDAYIENYENCSPYGLIITARCDISQEKVGVYSYIPLVSYKDWLKIDFPKILYNDIHKAAYNNLINSFIKIGGSERLFNTYSILKIKDKFLHPKTSKSKLTKDQMKFSTCIDNYQLIESLHLSPHPDIDQVIKLFEKQSKNIFKKLIGQTLAGTYFIDDVAGDGAHIIKLREIYHLKSSEALNLKVGVRLSTGVKYNSEKDQSYTIGEIRSPYIEHIMQKFSELFTRIGIDDPSPILIDTLLGE